MDLGQVFTNKSVAEYMASLLRLDKDAAILDPCFGGGAFLRACQNRGFNNIDGYEIDSGLFEAAKGQFPAFNLYNKDFLGVGRKKTYDGIIMNPPYVRQEKIDDLEEVGITKEKLRKKKIYRNLPTTANLYMYFILKALDLLKANGELVVIFPGSWIQARGGRQFRETLFSRAVIKKQVNVSGEVFEKNALVEVIILKLQKRISKAYNEGVHECNEITYIEINNAIWHELKRDIKTEELELSVPFHRYAAVRRGLTTGCNSMYINPDINNLNNVETEAYLRPIISSPKDVTGYTTEGARADNMFWPAADGKMPDEVIEYIEAWKQQIVSAKAPKTLYEKIQYGEKWYIVKPIDSQGILFSYFVRNDMKFIFNRSGCMARDNFYIIKPLIDEWLLFALLNNYYTYYQLEKHGKKYGAGLLKLQRYDIEELRFPEIGSFSEDDKEILILLAKKLENTGNAECINKITEIVSKYTEWSYIEIVEKYSAIKKYRLEGENNVAERS